MVIQQSKYVRYNGLYSNPFDLFCPWQELDMIVQTEEEKKSMPNTYVKKTHKGEVELGDVMGEEGVRSPSFFQQYHTDISHCGQFC